MQLDQHTFNRVNGTYYNSKHYRQYIPLHFTFSTSPVILGQIQISCFSLWSYEYLPQFGSVEYPIISENVYNRNCNPVYFRDGAYYGARVLHIRPK